VQTFERELKKRRDFKRSMREEERRDMERE